MAKSGKQMRKSGRKNCRTVSLLGTREEEPAVIIEDNTISRAQSGDEEAFVNLMRAHYAFVYAVVIGIVDNPHDAEEIVQDTFFNAYRGLADLEDTKKFKTWLAKIARNRALNWLRDQRLDTVSINEVSEHALSSSDAPDEQLIHREQRELIRRAIETLSPKEREIARSYYLEGASYDELTSAHGLSYKAISVRLSRAKQKLAKRLGHLLTGVFVFPATTLKKIYSGGLTVMKVGTASKITAGAVVIVVLVFIGTHRFMSSKEDSSRLVEVVTSTESAQSVTQTDAGHKGVVTAPSREGKPQISAEEMQQIENFFAQLDEANAQSGVDTSQPPSESGTESSTSDTSASVESTGLSAEEVMDVYVEAYKNLDFEAMLPYVTSTARYEVEAVIQMFSGGIQEAALNNIVNHLPEGMPEDKTNEVMQLMEEAMHDPMVQDIMQSIFSQVEVVGSEYVGDEFHFQFRMTLPKIEMPDLSNMPEIPGMEQPEIPELPEMPEYIIDSTVKMRKENGVWQIYE